MKKVKINLTLIEEKKLDSQQTLAYACIVSTLVPSKNSFVRAKDISRSIFGIDSPKWQTIQKGIDGLLEKDIIRYSYQSGKISTFDLSTLEEYECKKYVYIDRDIMKRLDEVTASMAIVFKTYLWAEYMVNVSPYGGVAPVYKRTLADYVGCTTRTLNAKLDYLKKIHELDYQDYSYIPFPARKDVFTLFLSRYENRHEINDVVKEIVPDQYRKDDKHASCE